MTAWLLAHTGAPVTAGDWVGVFLLLWMAAVVGASVWVLLRRSKRDDD